MFELLLFGLTPEVKPSPLIQNIIETQTVQVEPPKEPTLQEVNDPNNCEPTMYWAKEAPYYCIPKPTERRSDSTFQASSTRTPVSAKGSSTGNLYQSGQCTHWVASHRYVPNGWGDATSWKANAIKAGWTVSSTPVVNSIGWVYGHVVLVLEVRKDTVLISEQNYDWNSGIRTIEVPISKYLYLY